MVTKSIQLATLLFFTLRVNAHDHDLPPRHNHIPNRVERRQQQSPYPTGPAYDVPSPIESITAVTTPVTVNTLPVPSSYPGGSQPTLSAAPSIPTFQFVDTDWPTPDKVPPTNTPDVQGWLNELASHLIPVYDPNPTTDCGNTTVATAYADAGADGRCWWTCGGCTREIDITTCQHQYEWGHGYDDGPGLYTDKLLHYLNSKDIKATFYVVGSRVISRPEIVRYEYLTGHQIAVHTWSHTALTTLTTEQIVAELGWTRKAIKAVTGVTPLFMRPPFGDIDDRVRAISLAMGLIPIIWTSEQNPTNENQLIQWDSQDWKVHSGDVLAGPNQAAFQATLESSPEGVIVLQHDIYPEAVDLAIGYTIPFALNHNPPWQLKPVTNCQGRPMEDSYLETNTNPDSPAIVWNGNVATRSSNIGRGSFTGRSIGTGTIVVPPHSDNDFIGGLNSAMGLRIGGVLVTMVGLVVGAMVAL